MKLFLNVIIGLAIFTWGPSAVAVSGGADGVAGLRAFVAEVKSGRALFSQTVTSRDGAKKKYSSGYFEFSRPNRFRFVYEKPFEQELVGDGHKVWMFDPDLNQASSRPLSQALGATPAALLSGDGLDKDFELIAAPDQEGLIWALATPKLKEGGFQSLRVGFRGKELAALEIIDSFGQRSELRFSGWTLAVVWPAAHFDFVVPAGTDVLTH